MYGDCIDLFINMIIFSMRISTCACVPCDHIDLSIVMIIIVVHIQKCAILNFTGICKRMINNIVNSKTMFTII